MSDTHAPKDGSGPGGPSGLSTRALYIYWRIRPGREAEALVMLARLQDRLTIDEPGLQARRLQREDSGHAVTVMEIYARPGGVDAGLQARVDAALRPALQACCDGDRHVEVFIDLAPGPGC